MSWHLPTNVAEMAKSTAAKGTWHAARFDLAADNVAVLSYNGGLPGLDRGRKAGHALTDHVLTGAEAYRDHYMTTEERRYARRPHPSVVVYYVRDNRSGRVVLALQHDGTILDEIDTIRPDLRQATRDALRDAMATCRDRYAASRKDWED